MAKVILLRHGLSEWNLENRFTGWTDVPLAPQGEEEAKSAGELLKNSGVKFDLAYCSLLERAKKTLEIVLQVLGEENLETVFSWRLNERHYGALQGMNKKEIALKYGEEQTEIWRRSYKTRPPFLTANDPTSPANDPKYKDIPEASSVLGESLEDTLKRAMVLWNDEIMSQIKAGKNILLSLSGNSARAIVKNLDNISDEEISKLNIPTGEPLVYEFDNEGNVLKHYYLSPGEVIEAKIQAVKFQSKI